MTYKHILTLSVTALLISATVVNTGRKVQRLPGPLSG